MNINLHTTLSHVESQTVAQLKTIVRAADLVVQGTGKSYLVEAVWAHVRQQQTLLQKQADQAQAEKESRLAAELADPKRQQVADALRAELEKTLATCAKTREAFAARVLKDGVAEAVRWAGDGATEADCIAKACHRALLLVDRMGDRLLADVVTYATDAKERAIEQLCGHVRQDQYREDCENKATVRVMGAMAKALGDWDRVIEYRGSYLYCASVRM